MEKRSVDDGVPSEEVVDDVTERHLANARAQLRRALQHFESKLPDNEDAKRDEGE